MSLFMLDAAMLAVFAVGGILIGISFYAWGHAVGYRDGRRAAARPLFPGSRP